MPELVAILLFALKGQPTSGSDINLFENILRVRREGVGVVVEQEKLRSRRVVILKLKKRAKKVAPNFGVELLREASGKLGMYIDVCTFNDRGPYKDVLRFYEKASHCHIQMQGLAAIHAILTDEQILQKLVVAASSG